MCRATTCKQCGRPTWAGCGAHVEQVLGHVPEADRCQCGAGGGVELPFGGTGLSGHGREKGFEALYGFAALKTVTIKHG